MNECPSTRHKHHVLYGIENCVHTLSSHVNIPDRNMHLRTKDGKLFEPVEGSEEGSETHAAHETRTKRTNTWRELSHDEASSVAETDIVPDVVVDAINSRMLLLLSSQG